MRRAPSLPFALALLLASLPACGVGSLRVAPVHPTFEVRFVASGEEGERMERFGAGEPLILERQVLLDANRVREVQLERRPDNLELVVLAFDDPGREALATFTGDAEGRRLAIVVRGRIVSAPTLRGPITDGVAHIAAENEAAAIFEALTAENR